MPTLDITVGKKFTINTQNFSSVSPTVTLVLKDVIDTEDILKVHEQLEIIADGLLHKQIESDVVTMATIKKMGFEDYFKKVRENGNIDDVIQENIRKIAKLPPF